MLFSVLALALVACGDDDDDGGGGGGDLDSQCASACETSASLNCAGDTGDCVTDCKSTATAFPGCEAEAEALIACTAGRPASDFYCDEFDESDLKDGVCDTEGNALTACFLGGS